MKDGAAETAVQAILARAEDRFQQSRRELFVSMDRLFSFLMVGQWVFGVILALAVSPWAWVGKEKGIHPHVWVALVLGALLSSMPIVLAFLRPGWVVTRHVIAAAQMLWSALIIHLTGGRIESHFHVFGSLGILAGYRDWPLMATATVVVALEHFIRGIVWPESVYGIPNPEWWRFLEHAFWVVFAVAFLGILSRRGLREMRTLAERGAELEALSEGEWRRSSVVERAAS
jgi:two-component system, NtrC family, sensor histidine kinase HydH